MLENYEKYITLLTAKLDKMFDEQREFMHCRKGCVKCCSNAQYPFSEIEIQYLLKGFEKLPQDIKNKVLENIEKVKQEKHKFQGERAFTYVCPFLIDGACSVYDNRGIVCRVFGLISMDSNKEYQYPFCILEGLNYSDIYNHEDKTLSSEKMKELNITQIPKAYNVDYYHLISKEFEIGFEFGKVKSLIDWFD